MIFILRGGILMSIGSFTESLSQAILAGRCLVGRLGVNCLHLSICACHPCAGAMLIFSVSFQV